MKKIIEWAEARQILTHGTTSGQMLKLVSEVGEFADAIYNSDDEALVDAIGDVTVCCIILAKMHGLEIDWKWVALPEETSNLRTAVTLLCREVGWLADVVANGDAVQVEHFLYVILRIMSGAARFRGTTIEACLDAAYEVIKDRRGAMGPNGTWLKE